VLEEQALERQLKAAAFLPATKEDKDAYSLSEAERRTPTFRAPEGRQLGGPGTPRARLPKPG
jgi:hypothetical protein